MKPGYNNDIQIDPKLFIPPKPMNKKEEENQRMIEYYKMKIAEIEKERIEWMTKLEGLNQNTQDYYTKEWELRKLTDEITELQQSLSEANIALNQERKKVIHFNNEIESFKNKTKDDRRRMVQLLQFAEPIENSMKIYFDRRPELADKPDKKEINTMNKKNTNSNSVSLKKCVSKKGPPKTYSDYSKTTRKTPSDARQNVVKTIMFPSDSKENFVTDENKYLRKQKDEVKALYENMIMKMEEDSKLRDEEIRLQTNNMNAKLQELQRRKKNLEKLNNDIISGFMDLKYDAGINQKKLNDELELIKLQNDALTNSLQEVIRKNNVEKEVGKKEYARKTRQLANALRNQVKNKEENANLVKEQYKQIQQIYSDKVNQLQDKYYQILEKYNELRNRQGIQVEGYMIEMDRLRGELKKYENYAKNLKKMAQGNIDNFKIVEKQTDENNNQFLEDTSKTDAELAELKRKLKEELKEYENMIKGTLNQNFARSTNNEDENNRNSNNYNNTNNQENNYYDNTQEHQDEIPERNEQEYEGEEGEEGEEGNYEGEEGEEGEEGGYEGEEMDHNINNQDYINDEEQEGDEGEEQEYEEQAQ